MDKSYVTLEQCIICKEDTGTLFLDRRLKDRFEMHTTTPTSVCDKCKKKYLKNGTMLINPKTGTLAVIKDSAYKRLFNVEIPKGKIAFAEEEVLTQILGNGGEK